VNKGFTPTPERELLKFGAKSADSRSVWGFTVLEFLVILGILGVVASAAVFLLNPVELFREARDRQRIADVAELKKTIALYVASAAKPDLDSRGNCGSEYKSTDGSMAVDGTGWLPINFNEIPGGSTLAALPTDPINGKDHFYSYKCNERDLTFELNVKMESERYQQK